MENKESKDNKSEVIKENMECWNWHEAITTIPNERIILRTAKESSKTMTMCMDEENSLAIANLIENTTIRFKSLYMKPFEIYAFAILFYPNKLELYVNGMIYDTYLLKDNAISNLVIKFSEVLGIDNMLNNANGFIRATSTIPFDIIEKHCKMIKNHNASIKNMNDNFNKIWLEPEANHLKEDS